MARFFFHFRSAFFFLIFFLIALLVRLDGAGQGWASVDTRIILILHPMMANFDYSRGLFFRSNFASKKPEQLQAELEKGWKQAKPLIDSLLLKQSKAMDQRASIMLRRDETLSNMRSKNPGATAERAKDFHKLLAEYENRYSGFLASCDTQLDQIGNEIK
ncbi:hypothetical protein HYY75_07070, partial [bacterium]|nr:hypothetical protein [bacterium]